MTSLIDDNYDPWMAHALKVIEQDYGARCVIKKKNLLKFGRTTNADDGIETTIMTLQGATQRHETYVSDNLIDSISSADGGDTGEVYIEGHTVDSEGRFTFATQTVTLAGQTRVALTGLARVSRCVNRSASDWTGPVYIYENSAITDGVPDDATKTHLVVAAGRNQSQKAATTLSDLDFGLITRGTVKVVRGGGAAVNVDGQIQVRDRGGVFREQDDFSVRSNGNTSDTNLYRPFLLVPNNADIRMVCTATANDTPVIGSFNALIATKQ